MTSAYGVTMIAPRRMAIRLAIRRAGRGAEILCTVGVLFILSEAVFPLILHGGIEDRGPPVLLDRLTYWFAYGFTLVQLAARPRGLLRAAARNPFVVCVVAVTLLSVAWSAHPSVSLRRAFALSMSTVFGLYLAHRFRSEQLLTCVAVALGAIAILSLLFSLTMPTLGISHGLNDGAWRGVFTQKNKLGEMMMLSSLACGLLAARRRGLHVLPATVTALSIVLLYLSRSTTAFAILGSLALLIPAALVSRRGGAPAIAMVLVLMALCLLGSVAVANRESILNAVGKDITLTGRTALWSAVGDRIAARPWLGYGYEAFWLRVSGPSEAVRSAIGWDTPHAHNGFLDFWLDTGVLGLGVLLATLGTALWRAWTDWRLNATLGTLWSLAYLATVVLANVTESTLHQNHMIWALFVAVATAQPHQRGLSQ